MATHQQILSLCGIIDYNLNATKMKTVILMQKIAAIAMLLSLMSCLAWPRSEKYLREHSDLLLGQPDLGAGKLPLIYSDSGAYVLSINGETLIDQLVQFNRDGTLLYDAMAGVYKTDEDTIFVNLYYLDYFQYMCKMKLLFINRQSLRLISQDSETKEYSKNNHIFNFYDFNRPVFQKSPIRNLLKKEWIWSDKSLYEKWKATQSCTELSNSK